MSENGFLVPSGYVSKVLTNTEMNTCSLIWGFSLCAAVFSASKAAQQTWRTYNNRKTISVYIVMVWAEWFANVILSVFTWLYLAGDIQVR